MSFPCVSRAGHCGLSSRSMRRTALMAWLFVPAAAFGAGEDAVEVARPARLFLLVTDEQERALPGVKISLLGPRPGWPEKPITPRVGYSDDAGRVVVERPRPQDATQIVWSERITLELDGYRTTGVSVALFPGAQQERAVRLEAEAPKDDEAPSATRRLEGRLLRADGSVASGWLVAREARHGRHGFIHGSMLNEVHVRNLAPVEPDGRFKVDAETLLVLVSPEGIPMLYALNSASWPPGVRQVTLRVPEVRHVHHGVLVDAEGRPVAGLPIDIYAVKWNERFWDLTVGKDPWGYPERLQGAASTDGQPITGISTDDQGKYSVPTYFGTTAQLRVWRRGWSLGDWDGLATNARTVWRRRTPRDLQDLERLKVVTLIFEDEQGGPIPTIRVNQFTTFAAGAAMRHGGRGSDVRGQHLFVDRSVDRIEFDAVDPARNWKPLSGEVTVSGAEGRVVRVTLDPSQRLLPLAGLVAGPEGAPVPGIRVLLYAASEKPDRSGADYLGLHATTDEDGHFQFDAAPDDCHVEVRRWRDREAGLPGWTLPAAVNRQTRQITIRLNRGGTVKVELPPGMGDEAARIFLRREVAPEDPSTRFRNAYFTRAADGDELLSEIIRPGRYRLATYSPELTEAFAALGTIDADVKAGEETIVDLRSRKAAEQLVSVARTTSWNTVSVQHQSQVISGAEVTVFASVARREDMARWLQAWQSGDAAARETALTLLKRAGAAAVDAIRAADDGLNRDELLEQLGELERDGLHRLAGDLTDDAGTVRFEIDDGRDCVAVARVRGRMIGWHAFVAHGETVTIDLRPARTLLIRRGHSDADKDPYDDLLWARIRPKGPPTADMRGVMAALTHGLGVAAWDGRTGQGRVFHRRYVLPTDGNAIWTMEDLPIGTAWTVTVSEPPTEEGEPQPPRSARVRIEPGEGVQTVSIPFRTSREQPPDPRP